MVDFVNVLYVLLTRRRRRRQQSRTKTRMDEYQKYLKQGKRKEKAIAYFIRLIHLALRSSVEMLALLGSPRMACGCEDIDCGMFGIRDGCTVEESGLVGGGMVEGPFCP